MEGKCGRAPKKKPTAEKLRAWRASQKAGPSLRLNEHLDHDDAEVVFRHACELGLGGIVSKPRTGSNAISS
jgi:ATP-dependent DNA ligase